MQCGTAGASKQTCASFTVPGQSATKQWLRYREDESKVSSARILSAQSLVKYNVYLCALHLCLRMLVEQVGDSHKSPTLHSSNSTPGYQHTRNSSHRLHSRPISQANPASSERLFRLCQSGRSRQGGLCSCDCNHPQILGLVGQEISITHISTAIHPSSDARTLSDELFESYFDDEDWLFYHWNMTHRPHSPPGLGGVGCLWRWSDEV